MPAPTLDASVTFMKAPRTLAREPLTTRRVLGALLAAALAAILAGGALGFAAAQDPAAPAPTDDPDAPPQPFTLAAPRHGDVAQFVWESDEPPVHGTHAHDRSPTFTYAWSGESVQYDAHGIAHHVLDRHLTLTLEGDDGVKKYQALTYIDPDRHIPIGHRSDYAHASEHTFPSSLPVTEGRASSTYEMGTLAWPSGDELPDCTFFNRIQGTTIDLRDDVVLLDPCAPLPPVRDEDRATRTFRAVAEGAVGDRPAIVFAELGPDGTVTEAGLRLWLNEDVPYPLRLDVPPRGEAPAQTLHLVHFERGDVPFGPARDPGPALPPLEWAPATRLGFDDAALDHPYPLHRAFDEATRDPTYADLRDFLDEHPDATVLRTHHDRDRDDDQVHHRWAYLLGDGQATLTVCSELTQHHAPTRPGALPPLAEVAEHRTCAMDPVPVDALPTAPARLPTLASLEARWRTLSGSDDPLSHYTLGAECRDHDCAEPAWILMVGHERTDVDPTLQGHDATLVGDGARIALEASVLYLDAADGRMQTLIDGGLRIDHGTAAVAPEPTPPGRADAHPLNADPPRPLSAVSRAIPWQVPTGTYAAGAGLLALAAGLAYWLWPLAKAGLVWPLYSRVQRPRALDHPARAELFDLVTADPGIHVQELVRRTGRAPGDVQHHLRKLTHTGLLQRDASTGYTCYYPTGGVDRRLVHALPALKSDGARRLLEAIHVTPGTSLADAARHAGLTRQAAHHHVARLRTAGLVTTRRDGRHVRLAVTAIAPDALAAAPA